MSPAVLTDAAANLKLTRFLGRRLVETLGSTSCICSDKTGTLTQNIMTVAQVVYGEGSGCVTQDAPSSFTGGRKSYDINNKSFLSLLRCSVLNNVSTFNETSKWVCDEDGNKILDGNGNPTPVPFEGEKRPPPTPPPSLANTPPSLAGVVVQGDGSELKTVNWKPIGNASECAMIKLAQAESVGGLGDVSEVRKANPR